MRGTHNVQQGCECGSTIKMSSIDDFLDVAVIALWQQQHREAGHVLCSLAEARDIRYNQKRWAKRRALSIEAIED